MGSGEPTVKKKRTRKTKIVGGATLGLADIETEPRGDPPLPGPLEKTAPKASKTKLDDITLKRLHLENLNSKLLNLKKPRLKLKQKMSMWEAVALRKRELMHTLY